MPHGGQILLDGFNYDFVEHDIPKVHADGSINGETIHVRDMIFQDEGLVVTVRWTMPDWEEFKRKVDGAQVLIAKTMPPQPPAR